MSTKYKPWIGEAALILLLMILSFIYAWHYLSTTKEQQYYQYLFEPAVMFACDKGFISTQGEMVPELKNFLSLKSPTFDCKYLPNETNSSPYPAVKAWYYLLFFSATIWKVFGIAWQSINIFISALFSITVLLSYGFYRLGMGRLLAFVGAILFSLCISHYEQIANLRDYSVAPFLLGALFIVCILVTHKMKFTTQLVYSVLLGVVLGLGYGFRPDIIVFFPYMILVFLFFIPVTIKNTWIKRFICLLAVLLCFRWVIFPISSLYSHADISTAIFHFLLLGLTTTHTGFLELTPAVYYDWGYIFSDALAFVMTATHGYYTLGISTISYMGKAYGIAGFDLYQSIFLTFPADMFLRGLSSIYHLLSTLPTINFFGFPLTMPRNIWILTPIAVILICFFSRRLGLFLILTLAYFLAYPALVFQERHYFYLYFWWWWPVGFLCEKTYLFYTQRYFQGLVIKKVKANKFKVLFLLLGIVFVVVGVKQLLNHYQHGQVEKMFQAYRTAKVQAIPFKKNVEFGKMYFQLDKSTLFAPLPGTQNINIVKNPIVEKIYNADYSAQGFGAKVMKLSFDTLQCQHKDVLVDILYRYPPKEGVFNFSRTLVLTLGQGILGGNSFFLPIYYASKTTSGGTFYPYAVSLPLEQANCLTSISYVMEPHFYPLWLSVDLNE